MELDQQRALAITVANAASFAHPADSQKSLRAKQSSWDKFMRALDWDKIKKQQDRKNDAGGMEKKLTMLGIPVAKNKKG